MAAYQNGQLPSSALATIPGTSRQVRADLVGAVAELRRRFAARFGKTLTVTDGYRPLADQRRIFFDRYVQQASGGGYYGDVRFYEGRRYVRKKGTASASTPGQSNHGWGQAIDFGSGVNSSLNSAEYLWMRANAPALGWTHPEWARKASFLEPWHWEGVPVAGFVSNPIGGSEGSLPGIDIDPLDPLEEDMTPEQDARLKNIEVALQYPGGGGTSWSQALANQNNEILRALSAVANEVHTVRAAQVAKDGEGRPLPFDWAPATHNALADAIARLGALQAALATLSAPGGVDPQVIIDAAEDGANRALAGLTLVPKTANQPAK